MNGLLGSSTKQKIGECHTINNLKRVYLKHGLFIILFHKLTRQCPHNGGTKAKFELLFIHELNEQFGK